MNARWNWKNLKEVAFLVIGVMLVVSLHAHDGDLDRNYDADLKARAVGCRLQLGLGIPLAENCLDKVMKTYFDPNEEITTAAFRAQCHHLRQNNLPLLEGCPDG